MKHLHAVTTASFPTELLQSRNDLARPSPRELDSMCVWVVAFPLLSVLSGSRAPGPPDGLGVAHMPVCSCDILVNPSPPAHLPNPSGLLVIMHADRFKTSRTNAEQDPSCDVGREAEGLGDKDLITARPRERGVRGEMREIIQSRSAGMKAKSVGKINILPFLRVASRFRAVRLGDGERKKDAETKTLESPQRVTVCRVTDGPLTSLIPVLRVRDLARGDCRWLLEEMVK
ncbi:hypothetical protein EYF80_039476 [Liparis tanakae]|uniref:Uncharacterized protein n=1 Tax=Liparis tanakae TaxID=230148 RepID=A0A4Z2GAV6_9TELE|nr:hypothetical protein EYF80_039476 [Liparis tanakae]